MLERIFFLFSALLISFGCAKKPYQKTNNSYRKQVKGIARMMKQYPLKDSANNAPFFAGTTNFSVRRPNYVIIHHTAQNSCEQTLRTFTIPRTQVSAHYVVCREGTVFHMLNDLLRAQHAGVSRWGNNTDLNSSSIGIEVDNNGSEPFTEAQINSLLYLLARLKKQYLIPQANFLGHADVAPGRKVDPSRLFPWELLAQKGYGYWYDTAKLAVPDNFNPIQALRIIGYPVKDTTWAIQSYKIHFKPQDSSKSLQASDHRILFDLMRKYQ